MNMVAGMVSLYMVVEHFKGGDAAPVHTAWMSRHSSRSCSGRPSAPSSAST
jgi:hypothetical protein